MKASSQPWGPPIFGMLKPMGEKSHARRRYARPTGAHAAAGAAQGLGVLRWFL